MDNVFFRLLANQCLGTLSWFYLLSALRTALHNQASIKWTCLPVYLQVSDLSCRARWFRSWGATQAVLFKARVRCS